MHNPPLNIRLLISALLLSLVAHFLVLSVVRLPGLYNFSPPVGQVQWVSADMIALGKAYSASEITEDTEQAVDESSSAENINEISTYPPPAESLIDSLSQADATPQTIPSLNKSELTAETQKPVSTMPLALPLKSDSFLVSKHEKLSYIISMFGLPAGTAELEALNDNGKITLTLRVRSNPAFSILYPVDNLIETRHIDGRFIITKIRQQEGSFRSNEEFTINMKRKRITWANNINGQSRDHTVPTEDVFDTLSGIYMLRNRELNPGKTEMLHIFDSEKYAVVPVEILRRESVHLLNLTVVDALVIKPLQKTAGIFRRTGDILIWLTDDANKVPVKIVTSVALGTVTAELVFAESTSPVSGEESQSKTSR